MAVTVLPEHLPLTPERRADLVTELLHGNPRAWSAVYAPGNYVYAEHDTELGAGLDIQAEDLRVAFQSVTDWSTAIEQLRNLVRLEKRRRDISIGVVIDGRTIWGEPI